MSFDSTTLLAPIPLPRAGSQLEKLVAGRDTVMM